MKLFLIKLTAVVLAATGGYALDIRRTADEFSDLLSTDVSADVKNDAFEMEANTCGNHCERDSDCARGGLIQCGKCDLEYAGTQFYMTCVEPTPAPVPAPPIPSGNTCGNRCEKDSDCARGGFLQCGKCDLEYAGTQFYMTCVESTPAPAPPTPVGQFCGGQRMRSCRGRSRIAMCCPPSRRQARKGKGYHYKCVSSGGGMQAQCPGEDEVDFLEVDEIDTE